MDLTPMFEKMMSDFPSVVHDGAGNVVRTSFEQPPVKKEATWRIHVVFVGGKEADFDYVERQTVDSGFWLHQNTNKECTHESVFMSKNNILFFRITDLRKIGMK